MKNMATSDQLDRATKRSERVELKTFELKDRCGHLKRDVEINKDIDSDI